jgi:hypothetical protein
VTPTDVTQTAQTASPTPSPTKTPAANPTIYRTVSAQACSVFQAPTIRTLRPQGDLMAWSEVSNTLAYLAPSDQWDQAVGLLDTISIPPAAAPSQLAIHVAGNLSWSPDGKHIAFSVLRLGEGLYSLQVSAADGSGLVDFFPGDSARTDEWSSPKLVSRWLDAEQLEIFSSCGVNCAASFAADLRDGSRKPTGAPPSTQIDLWQIHRNTPAGETFDITKASSPNWSFDKNRIAYFDNTSHVWVLSKTDKNQFMLGLGKWDTPFETKWSADGEYLAVRTDVSVQVFEMGCEPEK